MTTVTGAEQRVRRLEDHYAIKRVQHEYGYALDTGDVAAAAALFTDDAELAVGPHHTYRGRAEILAYLRASLQRPTAAGALGIHLQLMPVITLAADGGSARATWRELGFGGGPDVAAYWAEGPQENTYLKTPEGWRIHRLHWYRTLHVPYEGGWQHHEDQPPAVPPASGPSLDYRTWPHGESPRFHFLDADEPPAPRADEPPAPGLAPRIQALADRREIENLQAMLGFYTDKGQWEQATNLFSRDAQLLLGPHGDHLGREAIASFLASIGPAGPAPGRLFDVMQLQPVIEVDSAAGLAHGRWRLFAQLAQAGVSHEWGSARAEVTYLRTEVGWRIARMSVEDLAVTSYEKGWGEDLRGSTLMAPEATAVGQRDARVADEHGVAADSLDTAGLGALLGRVEAALQIERTQYIYGYCLATFEWATLADLFADDGTIEVALRGVYRGRASVRASLELYGAKPEYGVLHNHMQMQPVIHVDEAATHATLRARALSMMGVFQSSARWMGGLYENEFARVGDTWKFVKDQVVNTYFAPYDLGWKDLPQQTPPGVSDTIPPDAPPSHHFDMYPRNFLLPYSYPDPLPSAG